MKKLTWLFMSLMLFLGMGTAFAIVPTPAVMPASGTAVPPGAKIDIKLPASMNDNLEDYMAVVVVYVENNEEVSLTPDITTLLAASREDMGMGGFDEGETPERLWKTASLDTDPDAETYGMWMSNVKISETATGTVKLRMRLATVTYSNDLQYSDDFSVTYTIDANTVVRPTAPAFTLENGKLYLENGYTDQLHMMFYIVDGTDAAFDGVGDVTALYAVEGLNEYEPSKGIVYTDGQTIKAVTAEIILGGSPMKVILSDIVTYPEVVMPDPPADPVFNPDGGEIEADAEITLTTATDDAVVYYSFAIWGISEATFTGCTTEAELDASGLMSGTSFTLDESGEESGDLTVLAAAALITDGKVTWSNVISKDFTIKAEEPADEVAQPVITPASDAQVYIGTMVTVTCGTDGAEIYYTTDGTAPFTDDNKIKDGAIKYTEAFPLTEAMLVKQGNAYSLKIRAVAIKDGQLSLGNSAGYAVYPNAPVFSPVGLVDAGTQVTITCVPSFAEIYYTIDGTEPTEEDGTKYTAPIEITEAVTIKAIAVLGQYQTPNTAIYKIKGQTEAVTLSFNPENGSTVEEGAAVAIVANDPDVDIFYMMFESEEAAKAAAWDQEEAESYNTELMPKLTPEKNTIKAAYAYQGAEAVEADFFYATYTVNALPAIELTFDPESGSEVAAGTAITITASRETEISYNLYADKEAADADEAFWLNAKDLEEDGDPVITEGNTYLRCAISDKGELKFIDAEYTLIETPGLPEMVKAPVFEPVAGEVEKGTEITWTWDESYAAYEVFNGVAYVVNGKDEDLDIDAAKFQELLAAFSDEDETTVREDGTVYLFAGEEAGEVYPYKVEKNATIKARMILAVMDESAVTDENEMGIVLALSPVETAVYTVKGEDEEPVETVATPTFNLASGSVEKGTKVEITCTTEGAVIYYTVDGTEPTAESTKYETAIEITGKVTIKAIAIKGDLKSEVAEATYELLANEALELAGVSVYPNPSNGLFNLELPVAATVEVFAANGVLTQRLTLGEGNATLNINRSGIYFLRITGEGRTVIKRIIVR